MTSANPSTTMDHTTNNGTTTTPANNAPNAMLTSSSIDTSTSSNAQHMILKTSASGGPTVSSMAATGPVHNRMNIADKPRSQTVRVSGTGVRRRETIDPVPGGSGSGAMRRLDSNEKSKVNPGET
jgi:hypothetical protein